MRRTHEKSREDAAMMLIDQIRDAAAGGTSIVVTMFHGTTHAFDAFSDERVNNDNCFGRQIYFTSSETDAEMNYASESGPDLVNRIDNLSDSMSSDECSDEDAHAKAKSLLYGGREAVLISDITLRRPVIIGDNTPHGIVESAECVYDMACRRAAENLDILPDVVLGDPDPYEDDIFSEMGEIQDDLFFKFRDNLDDALSKLSCETSSMDLAQRLFSVLSENEGADDAMLAFRSSECEVYTQDGEYLSIDSLFYELMHAVGHDVIVQPNAEKRYGSMNIEPETVHVAVSTRFMSQIPITETIDLSRGSAMEP